MPAHRDHIMTSTADKSFRHQCGLVLPGGGARGAYQVGVLKAIRELHNGPVSPFGVICGTSAGAVNAAVLASHADNFSHAIDRLENFWSDMECQRVYRTDAWTVLTSSLRWLLSTGTGGLIPCAPRSLLDNKPLKEFLTSTLRLEGIDSCIANGTLKGVAVTASAYTRSSAVSFYQGHESIMNWRRSRREGRKSLVRLEHLMASVALPLLFPAQRIGHEYYGDGGMRSVAPLSPAIHLGARKILVIGTRDEHPDPEPVTPRQYPSVGEIGGYLLDTVFMDTLNTDLARLARVNETLSLIPEPKRIESQLNHVNALVIRPSRDLRDVTAEHAKSIPWAVKLLLRILGGWGRDWRMASYLLFEAPYCQALIQIGYDDAMRDKDRITHFLSTESLSAD